MINKNIIKDNFSKYAKFYDRYSIIQNRCADILVDTIDRNGFDSILDIGCGTGYFTKLLKNKFPDAAITAIDISEKMIKIARQKLLDEQVEYVTADAEKFETKTKFDLIASNATLQWFHDLNNTLIRYKKIINKGGLLLFSYFGPDTFNELNNTIKEVLEENVQITASNFISKIELENITNNLFENVSIKEQVIKQDYPSLKDLLKTIKHTGTKGNGIIKRILTPGLFSRIEKIYINYSTSNNITATYQIFFCKAIKQ